MIVVTQPVMLAAVQAQAHMSLKVLIYICCVLSTMTMVATHTCMTLPSAILLHHLMPPNAFLLHSSVSPNQLHAVLCDSQCLAEGVLPYMDLGRSSLPILV